MKKLLFLIFIFINVFVMHSFADENGYIIKLKDPPFSLFSAENMSDCDDKLRVVNEEDKIYAVKNLEDIYEYIPEDMIEHIEPDFEMSLFDAPNDTNYYSYQWNMELINAPDIWESGCFGQDIKIAVIDSGVNPHDDINGNLIEGYNYIDSNTDVTDLTGHGTFVSGIIAAVGNNSNALAGLAYRAKIVPLKVFSGKTTNVSYIISAIGDAVDTYGCNIINLSFGDTYNSPLLEEKIRYAVSKGVIVVAACGNDSDSRINYPASYDGVISVSSVGSDKIIDPKSTHNAYVDVTAPGKDVYSLLYTNNESQIAKSSGTSFSAPIVSALAALCLNMNPEMNCSDFMEILKQTSEDLGDEGRDDYYGYGLINAKNVLDFLLSGKDYFVAPLDYNDEIPSSVIYNNTDETASLFSIFKDSSGMSFSKKNIRAKSGNYIYFTSNDQSFTHYLWKTNLCPLLKNTFAVSYNNVLTNEETN